MKILCALAALSLSLSAYATASEGARTGTIKWHNAERGYGIIKAHQAVEFQGSEFFYQAKSVTNYSVLADALLSGLGQPICATFDLVKKSDKLEAVNVRVGACL